MFRQIVDGVRFIHKAGIIHSDIKHLNVMVQSGTNKPFIIDLGSGIEANNNVMAQSATIRENSKNFSPPEYFKEDTPYFKSDVWSLGCLLYFMITGFNPWDSNTRIFQYESIETYFEKKQELIQGSIKEIQDKCAPFQTILDGCLQYDILKRWDINQLLQEVDAQLKK